MAAISFIERLSSKKKARQTKVWRVFLYSHVTLEHKKAVVGAPQKRSPLPFLEAGLFLLMN
jgi:hypothetical protein